MTARPGDDPRGSVARRSVTDASGRLWRDRLDVVGIGHVGANGFGHVFARYLVAFVAPVLWLDEIACAFGAALKGVVKLTKLRVEAGDGDFTGHLVDDVAYFVAGYFPELSRGEPFRNASHGWPARESGDGDTAHVSSQFRLRDFQYWAARSRRCDLVICFTR